MLTDPWLKHVKTNTKSPFKTTQTVARTKSQIWKNVCVFSDVRLKKEKKTTLTLVTCGGCFYFDFATNRLHIWILTLWGIRVFPLIHVWWLFHVHKAMKRLSHVTVEMFFLWSSVKYIHRLTWLSDWLTGRLSVICICVVLLYSKSNWMVRQHVCFIIRYPFFIWVQWDHVETIYDNRVKKGLRDI